MGVGFSDKPFKDFGVGNPNTKYSWWGPYEESVDWYGKRRGLDFETAKEELRKLEEQAMGVKY